MSFIDLSTELQTLQLFQFEMFTRAFWLFLLVSFSLIYIFYWKPYKQKETPFYSIATIQGILHIFCIIVLIVTPLLFLTMSPQDGGWNIIFNFIQLYILFVGIYALTLNVDLIKYGIPVLLRMGGLKLGDEKAEIAYRKLFGNNGNKHR